MKGVSIIIPTYNGVNRGYLQHAIDSVLNQSHPKIEVIIIDDGSTDQTANFCKQYLTNPKVSYIYQKNQGPASARNNGINHAKYDYICFLDDDDFYEPCMVEKMHRKISMDEGENLGMVYCRTRYINKMGTILKTPMFCGDIPIYEALFYGNILTTSSLMINRKVFDTVGVFREYLEYAEDYDLWFRIAKKFEVVSIDEILVNYRVHDNQLSNNPKRMEVFHSLVLYQAIESATPSLSSLSDRSYYLFYLSYMKIYLSTHCFKDFRRMLLSAKAYGPISIKWRIKYWLSYIPKLFLSMEKMVRKS